MPAVFRLDERFAQARLKRAWANEQINLFNVHREAFLKTDFCKVIVENDPDGSGQRLRIGSIDPLPAELMLVTGDAVHNLKCALDYIISEILGHQNTRITFPMGEEVEELRSSFVTKEIQVGQRTKGKGRNAAIEIAAPGIGDFIVNKVRPYKSATGLLWLLNQLDRRDKHRLLVPVLIPQSLTIYDVTDAGGNTIGEITGRVDQGGIVRIGRFRNGGLKIGRQDKPTAEIFFHETGIVEFQPVLTILMQMSQAVAETIDCIDDFLTSTNWQRARL